jgi:predicted transcriptional regulator
MLKDRVLDLLFKEEITQKELTTRLKSSRSRISEVLRQLEKQGFIIRKRISQRTVIVSLNHSGTLRVGLLRSAEYVHVISALHDLEDRIPFRVTVYDNSLEALKELMTGSEDIVASPLISGYFFYLIDRSIRPVAGVAQGGAGLIKRKESGRIGTTPLSRMDRDSREFANYEQVYFKSMEDMLRSYKKGEIEAAQIWEPFLTMNHGVKNPPSGICCCLFNRGKPAKSVNAFIERYKERVNGKLTLEVRKEISRQMSEVIDVRESDVFDSLDSYIFTTTVSREDLEKQIETFGLPVVKEVEPFLERTSKVPV